MSDDFSTFSAIVETHLRNVPPEAWAWRTGTREKDWTLHETLAHVVAIAALFNQAARAALDQTPLEIPGLTQRDDLAALNARNIAEWVQISPDALITRLISELQNARDLMTAPNLHRTAYLRVYNGAARALDFLDWQLSHAGVIHAAQLTRPLDQPPLWTHYPPEMTRRQVDRFLRHFCVAYWPGEPVTLNFAIGDETCYIQTDSRTARCAPGTAPNADHTMYFRSAAVFFEVFTVQRSLITTLKNGECRISGDLRHGLAALRRFSASRPTKTI